MKVHLAKGINGYSGTSDGAVYYYHSKLKLCLMRTYVVPKNKPNTDRTKAIMKNLKKIQPSDAYKTDFKAYLYGYNDLKEHREKPALSWYNLYIKMLFKMQETLPPVSLLTLSKAQIYADNLPCKCIKDAVEAGLLPVVPGYERLDNGI